MAIPTPVIRNLESNSILRTMAIDLSDKAEDRAAIIEILRSKLYSDKILAVIREYSTNASDSHVEAGNGNEAIKVTLPTQIFPEFRIRDFGIGLTPDEVDSIYIKYGRSTKRATNEATGQLGLGCKSAFAYGDNFVVISYKDGVKTTYNLTINGVCATVAAEPMENEDRNGIEVIIPVNQSDIREFQDKAMNFFKYWKVCPDLVGGDVDRIQSLREELATKPMFSDDNWEIRPATSYYGDEAGIAVMGNIPYPINWSLISNKMDLGSKDAILYEFVRRNKTILRFGIGELDFSASRESLEYTDKTCKTIVAKTKTILDSIFTILNNKISSAPTYWDALLVYNQIFGRNEDKIFQGDVYKLENYYKGKFNWNGIVINSGTFENIQHWDTELGYIGDKGVKSDNPILTVYEKRNGRIRQQNYFEYGNVRIPASKKIRIIIHDLDKPTLTKSSAKYVINTELVTKVYFLRFKDKAQMNEFITKMHFESVPVIYVSSIHDKVKQWLKQTRITIGGGTPSSNNATRDPQTIRYFVPAARQNKYGYFDDVSWIKKEVDIREEEGYYVDLVDGKAKICGNEISNLSCVSHYSHILLTALNEKVDCVYALPERNRNAKWFKTALEDGQWTNLETYLKNKKAQIIHNNGLLIAKAVKYFKSIGRNFQISINFAERILLLLENKSGAMYKACVEILPDFKKVLELNKALHYFNMDDGLEANCDTNFESLFEAVEKQYPMLSCIKDSCYIFSIRDSNKISTEVLIKIAQYINLVDQKV